MSDNVLYDVLLYQSLTEDGYRELRLLPTGEVAGLLPHIYTTGLFVGLTEHCWARRYCYEYYHNASDALKQWDGQGDPPGNWVKEKPSERLGPGLLK
jgi:hypothetical protein